VESALGTNGIPTKAADLQEATRNAHGIQRKILVSLQNRLKHLPKASRLFQSGVGVGLKAFEMRRCATRGT
jgi:hypothetical protein